MSSTTTTCLVSSISYHLPFPAEPRAVDAGKLLAERLADSPWITQQRADDELRRRAGDLRRQPLGQSPPGRGRRPQLVRRVTRRGVPRAAVSYKHLRAH